MKFENIDRFFSMAANFGVIIGIIFLVVEINQNNELLAAQDRYNRLQVAIQGPQLFLEDANLIEIFYETPPSERTDAENIVVQFYWRNIISGMEWTFRELSRDEIPVERWRRSTNSEDFLAIWDLSGSAFDPEFVEYVEANVVAFNRK